MSSPPPNSTSNPPRYTAFAGERLLASGVSWEVGVAVRKILDRPEVGTILIFDDRSGRQIDFDLRGTPEEVTARLQGLEESKTAPETAAKTTEAPRAPGRPKLGVVAREVTLLPRHWDWLLRQPGGASATLRRLVEAVRKQGEDRHAVREAQQAADRFMMAMLGDRPGYEEAARALYAADRAGFLSLSESWPADLRDYARRLAAPAFDEQRRSDP